MSERLHVSSGAPREASVGYSRAVRIGDAIYVAGTTALDESGEYFGDVRPAATMVQVSRLIDKRMLVEIEAEARLLA